MQNAPTQSPERGALGWALQGEDGADGACWLTDNYVRRSHAGRSAGS